MSGYSNSLEHLLEELRRIDLLVRRQVLRLQRTGRATLDAYRGLYLSEDEVDSILTGADAFVTQTETEDPALRPLLSQLAALETDIGAKKAASMLGGTVLRLERLRELFRLSALEVDALLICLAPELDQRYQKLYAYLHDDVTRKQPSVGLIIALLCESFLDALAARGYFAPTAPLLAYQLLHRDEVSAERPRSLLATALQVDERIVAYLCGADQCDMRLAPYVHWRQCQVPWPELILPVDLKERLEQLLTWYCNGRGRATTAVGRAADLIFYLRGPSGVGKQTMAAAWCRELGLPLLVVDVSRLLQGDMPFESTARLVCREAQLQQAALYCAGFDRLLAEDDRLGRCRDTLIEALEEVAGVIFLHGQGGWQPPAAFQRKIFIEVEFPAPPYALRKELWQARLNGCAPTPSRSRMLWPQPATWPGGATQTRRCSPNRILSWPVAAIRITS
jgi:hypothetical protein